MLTVQSVLLNGCHIVLEMSQYTLELAMEVVDDLRILFDFMLPLILLYGPERQQYKRLRENATVNNQGERQSQLFYSRPHLFNYY